MLLKEERKEEKVTAVIIGNILTLTGSLIMVYSGYLKEKKKIVFSQMLMYVFFAAGNLVLGGITGSISNGVNIFRNLYALRHEVTGKVKAAFLLVQFLLTLIVNREGAVGWCPALASALITVSLSSENAVVLKAAFIGCQVLFAIYDISIRNYTSLIFDAATVIATVIGIIRVLRERKISMK